MTYREPDYHKSYYRANITESRRTSLMLKYGITLEYYEELMLEQNGCCAICGIHHTKLKRRLDVDHCHDTGTIRGLLCGVCNRAIGTLGDSIESIEKVLSYMKGRI